MQSGFIIENPCIFITKSWHHRDDFWELPPDQAANRPWESWSVLTAPFPDPEARVKFEQGQPTHKNLVEVPHTHTRWKHLHLECEKMNKQEIMEQWALALQCLLNRRELCGPLLSCGDNSPDTKMITVHELDLPP